MRQQRMERRWSAWGRSATFGALALVAVLLASCAPAAPRSDGHPALLASLARSISTGAAHVATSAGAMASTTPTLSAREAILVDSVTGRVYLAVNADTEMPMASTTKIMTALVALSFGNLDQRITVGADAASLVGTGASVAYLQQGESYTLRELLYGLLLPSGDDAAVAIADGVAGSQNHFVQLMNLEATLLGLGHTHYSDVHGLDAPGHYTTARDLAALTAVALRSPVFAQIVATPVYTLAANSAHGAHTWTTTNLLLSTELYPGVLGVKTGFTGGAGYCLVFTAARPFGRLVGVVLGEPNEQARFDDAAALLTWGFAMIRPPAHALPASGEPGIG
jgi:D-alanyl-D-alanine carboxypeptidase (penicillin-binding protein 5/6)